MNLFSKRKPSETFEARTRREQLEQLKARYPNARWNTPDTFEYVVQTRFGPLAMSVHLPQDFPTVAPVIRVLIPVQHAWVNPSGFLSYCPKIMTWQKSNPDVNSLLTFIAHHFQANPPAPAAPGQVPPPSVAPPAGGGYPGASIARPSPTPTPYGGGGPAPVPPPPSSGGYNPYGPYSGYTPSPAAPNYRPSAGVPAYPGAYSGAPAPVPPPPTNPTYTPSTANPYNPNGPSSVYNPTTSSAAPIPSILPRPSPSYGQTPAPVPAPQAAAPIRPSVAPLERRIVEEMSTERLKELDNDQALVRAAVHDLPALKALTQEKEALEKEISDLQLKLQEIEESSQQRTEDGEENYADLLKQEIEVLTKRRQEYAAIMGKFSLNGVCNSLDAKANAASMRAEDILERMGQTNEGDLNDVIEEYINAQKDVHVHHILMNKVREQR